MSDITVEDNVSSCLKIENSLTRCEILLKILDGDTTGNDDIPVCIKNKRTLISLIVRRDLNIGIHVDVTIPCEIGIGHDREIGPSVENRLDITRIERIDRIGIDCDLLRIDQEMPASFKQDTFNHAIKADCPARGLDKPSVSTSTRCIGNTIKLGMPTRIHDDMTTVT